MSQTLKIIFMGTPEFALPTLEALVASEHEVIAAYSQPPRPKNRGHKLTPSPVHKLAEKHGIPVYTPTSLKSEEAQAEFAALKPDIAVVVAYGLLLPQAILDAPAHGCINIHPSALPRWRGAAPLQRTIMAGDDTTEICIMKMDAGLDTGDVYLRSALITIDDNMNAGDLHDMLAEQSAPLLLQTLSQIAAGNADATLQADDGVTYADKISKECCRIDWSWPAAKIHNHIRGLSPFPGAWTVLDGKVLKVYKANIVDIETGEASRPSESSAGTTSPHGQEVAKPGSIINDQLTIHCKDGTIQLLEVQKPGKPRMDADAFLRGHPVAKGAKLG